MFYHQPDIKKTSVAITSTSDIVVVHYEICIGLDHPLITELLESNLAVCREKYDDSNPNWRQPASHPTDQDSAPTESNEN